MKKEVSKYKKYNKKVIVLSLFILVMISTALFMQMQLIRAQSDIDPGDEMSRTVSSSTPYEPDKTTFFGRWFNQAFSKFDAKMILWIMMFIVLLVLLQSLGLGMGSSILLSIPASFVLVAYVTPESIIGVFRSYQTLPLVFATFLPLAILFGITYLSVVKGSRTLMTTQWLLWGIYTFYSFAKGLIVLLIYWDAIPTSLNRISEYVSVPASGTEQFAWFLLALAVQIVVGMAMTFWSGKFMNWALTKTTGIENAAAMANMIRATNAAKQLAKMEKDMGKSP